MGLRELFRRRPKGRELWLRQDYASLPPHEWTDDEYDHYMATCSDDEYWAQWDHWSRQVADHPSGVRYVRRQVLEMARASAEDTDSEDDPKEFACMLRVEGDTVTEIALLAGTVAGDEHAVLDFWNAPVDRDINGSLHSHPDEHPYPSDADFELFSKHGVVHMILCRPYGPDDWRAYDFRGIPVRLEVVD